MVRLIADLPASTAPRRKSSSSMSRFGCKSVRYRHGSPSHPIPSPRLNLWHCLLTLSIGSFSELLRTPDDALHAYERALIANPQSLPALNAIGMLLKGREAFDKALEFFRTIVDMDRNNGEAWGNLGMLSSQTPRHP